MLLPGASGKDRSACSGTFRNSVEVSACIQNIVFPLNVSSSIYNPVRPIFTYKGWRRLLPPHTSVPPALPAAAPAQPRSSPRALQRVPSAGHNPRIPSPVHLKGKELGGATWDIANHVKCVAGRLPSPFWYKEKKGCVRKPGGGVVVSPCSACSQALV